MDELKNRASKIKQEQEKYLEGEELSSINLTQNI
jgi:hypothetical protein